MIPLRLAGGQLGLVNRRIKGACMPHIVKGGAIVKDTLNEGDEE